MNLTDVVQMIFSPSVLLLMTVGVTSGLIVGAIPGLSATMAMALITPLTFSMDSNISFALLCSVYVGAISGGLYSAILLRIPGTSSSIATCFDGFPLARKGEAGKAIGAGIVSSFIGGTFSFICLMTIAPLLAKFALKFGPAEYFAVSVLGLSTIASVVKESTAKGLLACLFGLLASTVGLDRVVGVPRFTFGSVQLTSGFDVLAILIGLFAIPQILSDISDSKRKVTIMKYSRVVPPWKELKHCMGNFFRSSILGTWIGILPGAGGSIASLLAYDQARRASKEPEKFGTGVIDGVVASETANNAVIGGAIIPLLTLGIPGDTPAAVMLAALTIHGLQPGPLLFKTNPEAVNSILLSLYVSNILMIIIAFAGAKYIIRILKAPKNILLPLVVIMCLVGTFAVNQRMFDVWVMIIAGLIGYIMERYGYPVGPAILGVVLGPIIETNLRQAIQVSNTGFWDFFTRPLSSVILLLVLLNFLWPFIKDWFKKLKYKGSVQVSATSESEPEKFDKTMPKINRITGIVFIIFAGIIYKLSEGIAQTSIESAAYGPSFYPKVLAVCFALLSAVLVIFPFQKGDKIKDSINDKKSFWLGAILIVAYPLLIPIVGFVTVTIIYLALSFLVLGGFDYRNIPKYVVIASISSLAVYYLFEKAFVVLLPHGLIF